MLADWLTKAVSSLGYWATGPAKLTEPAASQYFGGGHSYAGRSVTVEGAMRIATAWACIRLISQTWGTLPFEVRRYDERTRGMVPARDHPLHSLLHDAPSQDMSAAEFWSALGVALLTYGNAYAEIHRTSAGIGGRVVALTPLRPEWVAVRRDDNGALVYHYAEPRAAREIAETEVLHIKGVTLDGITGLSPIAQARNTLGIADAANETTGKLFANGMRTGGYIKAPGILTEPQRKLADAMLSRFRGASNAGLTPILEGGWDFQSTTLPPQEAQLLATREFEIEEVARFYGVPPWLIGHTSKSTSWGTGLESQLLGFYTLTMRPILKNAEGAIRRRLLTPAERGRMEVEFNSEGLLRTDSQGRATFLKTMVESGLMTINEGRAREGLPPMDGCDRPMVQSNMLPVDALGKATSRADLPVVEAEAQPQN
jgi:HK97 family phage portal protein